MPFEFPTAPTVGDDYTQGGIIYEWDGTVWAIKGGGDPQDYVLKAGDTMTGGLGFGSSAVTDPSDLSRHLALYGTTFGFSITSGRLNYNIGSASNLHVFRVANVDKFQVHNTGIHVLGNIGVDGYVEVNGNHVYIDRTATGYGDTPSVEFRRGSTFNMRLFGHCGNNSGYGDQCGFKLQINRGSYGTQNTLDMPYGQGTVPLNVPPGLNAPSFNVTSDARLKENVRPVTQDEVTRLFGALRPVHYDRLTVLGEGATPEQCERSTPEYGFVANDIATAAGELVATMQVNNANTLVYSLSQVLAITIAKVQQLETEIAALKAQPRGRR